MDQLLSLSDRDLQEIVTALRAGRLTPPFSPIGLQHFLPGALPLAVFESLRHFADRGFTTSQIAATLDLLIADRRERPRVGDVVQLVTTGPEVDGIANRDTSVVVRDLFANATRDVLVAGYAIYQGQRVFQALADRMQQMPNLKVRLFLDIRRPQGDSTTAADLIRRFSDRFTQTQWPAQRPLPKVFFDPRSLDTDQRRRASLHAKCVVVDYRDVFVSSANFTEAAHERNIELGLVFRSDSTASSIAAYFDGMLRAGLLIWLM